MVTKGKESSVRIIDACVNIIEGIISVLVYFWDQENSMYSSREVFIQV